MEKKLIITIRFQQDEDGKTCLSYELDGSGIIVCHDLKDLASSLDSEATYFGTNVCGFPEYD